MNIFNSMNLIAEWNSLHDMVNNSKRTKSINSHQSSIILGCTNARKGTVKLICFESYWTVDLVL